MDKIAAIKSEIERIMAEEMSLFEEQCKGNEEPSASSPVVYTRMQMLLAFINSLPEEPANIDFEQELYKQFGQVKDFTLGMQIAKHFFHLGTIKEAEYNRDSEYKLSQMAVDVLDRKRVKPTLKGDALHRFKNEWNTIKQIMHWWETGKEFLNYRLALHWVSWGAQNLQGCFDISEEEKTKMDIKEEPVSEELEEAIDDAMPECMWGVDVDDDGVVEDGYDTEQMREMFKAGAKWQLRQVEHIIEENVRQVKGVIHDNAVKYGKRQIINAACDYLIEHSLLAKPIIDDFRKTLGED